jgi:hypothetical protein
MDRNRNMLLSSGMKTFSHIPYSDVSCNTTTPYLLAIPRAIQRQFAFAPALHFVIHQVTPKYKYHLFMPCEPLHSGMCNAAPESSM